MPIFPKEIIECSTEYHFAQFSVQSKTVYITVLLAIVLGFVALPFIYVDISVQANGIIRPLGERNKIKSPVSARVRELNFQENMPVERGQILLVLESEAIEEQLAYNADRILQNTLFISDLKRLINSVSGSTPQKVSLFQSPLYRQSYFHFRQKLEDGNNKYRKIKKEFERARKLYKAAVIARTEYDNKKFDLDKTQSELKLLKEAQVGQWQSELYTYKKELAELKSKADQLREEKESYIIKAPLSGTIQNFSGIYEGSFVFANQVIAEISPDSGLVVETYISPSDIGLIRKGNTAKFQIDAFNYNQWGIIKGDITAISNDIIMVDQQPVFKVECSLNKKYLELKNGYRGKLKKGMTLRARFLVAKRSLYQLLYDKVDDWMNPTQL